MSWRDSLQLNGKGSFRDIEFFVNEADSAFGRRTVLHEFPGRDKPMSEDLGRKARTFTLVCYVLGKDYMVDRDNLRKAFETAGTGRLVHPYFGEMTVTIEGEVSIRETTSEGGIARFTVKAVEVGEELTPIAVADTEEAVIEAVDNLEEINASELDDLVEVLDVITETVDAAVAIVNSVASTLNVIKGRINAVMNAIDSIGDSITAFANNITALILLPQTLAQQFQAICSSVLNSINEIGDAWNSYFSEDEAAGSTAGTPATSPTAGTAATGTVRVETLMDAFRTLFVFGDDLPAIDETTTSKIDQAGNQTALVNMIKTTVLAETCRAVVGLPLVSFDLATSIRDELCEALDTLLDTADDGTYGALVELRAAICGHLAQVAQSLPKIIEYTPRASVPALVIAQRLYGNSSKETEIIERNNIPNPFVVSNTEVLEVLSDV